MPLSAALRASSSGLYAERMRMDVISDNIANANSMTTKDGQEAYRRKMVVLTNDANGVHVSGIIKDQGKLRKEYDPTNPNAVGGFVEYSNVNPINEMVNLMTASRSYEANVSAFNAAKSMVRSALNIGKV